MTIKEVAIKFADHCKAGNYQEAEKLWAENIVSTEAMDSPYKECRGREKIKEKQKFWEETFDLLETTCEGPFINGNQFSLYFTMKTKNKHTGEIEDGSEVALYTVKNGEIVEERFMY